MAWTAPRTWVAGDVLTAAQMNEQIKANELILKTSLSDLGMLVLPDSSEKTIASGAITIGAGTLSLITVDTQSDASSDDLDTITMTGSTGHILALFANNTARTVVLKDGTGNLDLDGSDVTLDSDEQGVVLVWTGSKWKALARPSAAPDDPAVVAYAVTTANVVNTVTETTVLSFEVPANAWADGDVIFCWMDALFKNNEGSSRNITGKVNVGSGSQVQILSQSYGNSATEYHGMGMVCALMRSGSAVLVGHNIRDWDVPMGPLYPGGDGVVGSSSPANFTDAQTVYLKLTLAAADSTFYVQPQNARAWKVAAS